MRENCKSVGDMGIRHPGIGELGSLGGMGGLLKRVKNKSLMTFPDAYHLEDFMIYIIID